MSKNVIITGASRGIGAAIAKEFARNGYNLSLCCEKNHSLLLNLASDLKEKYNIQILTFTGDISSEAFVKKMIEETIQSFGSVDILINNAGISYVGLLTDMSYDEWTKIINTNLTSIFLTCKYTVPNMVSNKSGSIINISSVWGNVGASCEVAYSASKGGINSFTKALAKELAPSNIQVNAVACGVIDTDMNSHLSAEEKKELAYEIPTERFGTPEEIAHLVFQITDNNNYLTGQIITMDGGWI